MTLRHFLLLTTLPMIILTTGTALLARHIDGQMREHTDALALASVDNLLSAQRSAVNLEGLRASLKSLAGTSDPARARDAYITAWSLIAESSLEQHDETKTDARRLMESVHNVWEKRRKLDAARTQARQLDRLVHAELIAAFAAAHPVQLPEMPAFELETVDERHLPHSSDRLRRQPADVEKLYRLACPSAEDSDLCARIHRNRTRLEETNAAIAELKRAFEEKVAVMEAQTASLQAEYSIVESEKLLEDIRATNDISHPVKPVMALLIAVLATMWSVVFFGICAILRPLMRTMDEMHLFLETGVMPPKKPRSRIREIDEALEWFMRFCEATHKDRTEKALVESQYRQLLKESALDALTGVGNRKSLQDLITRNAKTRRRTGVLMIDIDHFKQLNDERGHPFGDKILEAVGRQLKSNIAANDLIYRYGGEEFCIIMPEVSPQTLATAAERLMHKVHAISRLDASIRPESAGVESCCGSPLTVSIGVSSVTAFDGEKDILTLIREADAALYDAKRSGRDGFRLYKPETEAPSGPTSPL